MVAAKTRKNFKRELNDGTEVIIGWRSPPGMKTD
jgi:hypothetical protein